jgi:hypothetical protein
MCLRVLCSVLHCAVVCCAGESYSRAYPDLLKLHMLQELEDAWGLQRTSVSSSAMQNVCDALCHLDAD